MLLPTALVTLASLAIAADEEPTNDHICWVERIDSEADGLRITFKRENYFLGRQADLHLETNASEMLPISAHSSCFFTAKLDGLEVVAVSNPPPLGPLPNAGNQNGPKSVTEWIALEAKP